jgi:uncharacterized membrane protein
MRDKLISLLVIVTAVVGWWGLGELTGIFWPEQPGALPFFFALLFLAVTATLAMPAAYLNRRFAPEATKRDPWRSLRHSAWGAACVAAWAWLQMHRVFHVGFALITILIFVAVEVLITRFRGEEQDGKSKMPDAQRKAQGAKGNKE